MLVFAMTAFDGKNCEKKTCAPRLNRGLSKHRRIRALNNANHLR